MKNSNNLLSIPVLQFLNVKYIISSVEITHSKLILEKETIFQSVNGMKNVYIYHLDLKTENIMFNDTENISDIKLIDFGSSVQSQGPEKDVFDDDGVLQLFGVYDTNQRTVNKAELEFRGIRDYVTNYTRFAIIT